ncbi:MAG: hypothetical protein AMS22_11430 [Thiotrichales bacterium SG8_50]|nr:MAG: hypothetical protein AMS22_11430 [Thiotrichales bacterium SG8_50]
MKQSPKKAILGVALANIVLFVWVYEIFDHGIAVYSHLAFSLFIVLICIRLIFFRVNALLYLTTLWAMLILLFTSVAMHGNTVIYSVFGKDNFQIIVTIEIILLVMGMSISYIVNRKNRFNIQELVRFKFINESNQTIKINSELGHMIERGRSYSNLLPFIYVSIFLFGASIAKFEVGSKAVIIIIALLVSLFFVGYIIVKGFAVFELVNRYHVETGRRLYVEGLGRLHN